MLRLLRDLLGAGRDAPAGITAAADPIVIDPVSAEIERYLGGIQSVDGYGIDSYVARIFLALDQCQKARRVSGNLLEIGVLQGRTGVLLALMAGAGEVAVLIDLFDSSGASYTRHGGNGDLQALRGNLARWAPDANTKIIAGDSVALDFNDYPSIHRGLRFVHVDGGHDKPTVLNDLRKCAEQLADGGIVVVDDFWHSGFPEVNEACHEFLQGEQRLVPLATGKNKLVLAVGSAADDYRRWLGDRLRPPAGRQVRLYGRDALCLDV